MDVLKEVDYEYEHSSIRDLSHAPSLPDEHSHSGRVSPQATRPSFKQMGSSSRGLGAAARVWESVSNMANNNNSKPELIRSHSHPQQQHTSPHPCHQTSHHYHETSSSSMKKKINFSQNITGRPPSGISNLPFDHSKRDVMDYDDEDLSGSIRDLDHAPSLPQDYSIMTSSQPKQPLPSSSSTRPRLGSMGRLWTSDHSILTSPSLPESSSKRKVNFAPQPSNSATPQMATPGSSRIRSYSASQVLSDRKLHIPELDSDQHSAAAANTTTSDRSSSAAAPPLPPPSALSEGGPLRDRRQTESSIITVEDIDKYGYEYESATPAVVVDMEHSEAWGSETEAANEDEEETAYEDDSTWAGRGAGGSGGGSIPSWIPGLDKIALLLVTFAPCFVLCGFKQRTYRAVLGRLNILLALCTIFPICAACFLVVVMFDPKIVDRNISVQQSPTRYSYDAATDLSVNIWAITGTQIMLGIMAFVILVATVLTCRVVRDVNLVGAIRYMFSILWMLPIIVYCTVSLFDYFHVTQVWVTHWWRDPQLAWFRRLYCAADTYNTLCIVPQMDNASEAAWCVINYEATNCSSIRDAAQYRTAHSMLGIYYVSAVWGIFLIALCFLSIDTVERIVSKPLAEKARTSSIALWLSQPILGSIMCGSMFSFSQKSALNLSADFRLDWVGTMFIAVGGLFCVAAVLGWYISNFSILSTSDKRKKLLSIWIFIVTTTLALILLAILFGVSLSFSSSTLSAPVTNETRGDMACRLDFGGGCSRCDQAINRCPEWSVEDVTTVVKVQAKASATLAAIYMVYAVGAVRVGLKLRKHIAMYQIEYV